MTQRLELTKNDKVRDHAQPALMKAGTRLCLVPLLTVSAPFGIQSGKVSTRAASQGTLRDGEEDDQPRSSVYHDYRHGFENRFDFLHEHHV